MEADLDPVFRALADPSRRRLLDRLRARDGQSLRELCADLAQSRQAVSKHLAVLAAANLVTTRRVGRETRHHLNPEPINAVADRWIARYHRERVQALADLKYALERGPMTEPDFVYTTYIHTTPEQLWQALTDPAFTRRYWGVALISDWTVGATITWQQDDVTIADPEQVVLAAEPGRRLSYTWHTCTPAWAGAVGLDPDTAVALAGERRSTVTFELEPVGGIVKLTVVHGGFPPASTLRRMVGEGWPHLLADLKTLLETGDTMPAAPAPA